MKGASPSTASGIVGKAQSIIPASIIPSSLFRSRKRHIKILLSVDFDAVSGFLGTGMDLVPIYYLSLILYQCPNVLRYLEIPRFLTSFTNPLDNTDVIFHRSKPQQQPGRLLLRHFRGSSRRPPPPKTLPKTFHLLFHNLVHPRALPRNLSHANQSHPRFRSRNRLSWLRSRRRLSNDGGAGKGGD